MRSIIISLLLFILIACIYILLLLSEVPDPIPIPTPYIYSDFDQGFGLYIVNSVRITYDEISDTQHMISIDNKPVRIHKTEKAAKEQMERLLKYYLDL